MGEHAHSELEGISLIAAAQGVFAQAGEQWTDMRADVFAALAECDRPVSAYELAETVSSSRGKRVAPNSVYRILDLFVRTNLARRVESANAYIVTSHPGCRHDCIFLICDSCGEATHIDDDSLTGSLISAAAKAGFTEIKPVVELRGICAGCS